MFALLATQQDKPIDVFFVPSIGAQAVYDSIRSVRPQCLAVRSIPGPDAVRLDVPKRDEDMKLAYPASVRNALVGYATAAVLSLAVCALGIRLWCLDLNVPLSYSDDGLWTSAVIKGMIENGWYLTNPNLGAPGVQCLADYPNSDTLHLCIFKLIAILIPSYGAVLNIYYILTYPLTTITSLFVLRHFRFSFLTAIAGSLLYTFLPYHFYRGEHHIFLAAYYLVPLVIMVCLWIFLDTATPFFSSHDDNPRFRLNRYGFGGLLICFLVASSGVYYAFFACVFLLTSGACASLFRGRAYPLVSAAILICVLVGGVLLNLIPHALYVTSHGSNPGAFSSNRSIGQAEEYGLKFVQLVLPQKEHRLPLLGNVTQRYGQSAPFVNENDMVSLGFIGTVGFLVLLGRVLYRKPQNKPRQKLADALAALNITALGLGTVGGVGVLVSLFLTPSIRSYNRICIYIAFVSIMMIVVLLEKLRRHWHGSRGGQYAVMGAIILAVGVGLLDQTGSGFGVPGDLNRVAFDNDAAFVQAIESSVPEGSMVFQLPYVAFPELGTIEQMTDYQHFRPYLHSRSLRWSFGAMRGRDADAWQRGISNLGTPAMVEALANAGFKGIHLNRSGFPDRGAALEAQLSRLLSDEGLTSGDKNMVFFSLMGYADRLKKDRSRAD